MLAYGIPPEFCGGASIYETAIRHRDSPELSGHAIAYRWCSLPRVRRHRASKPQGSSKRVLPWQITIDQLICASLSHIHYWYEVGMLKAPATITVIVVVFFTLTDRASAIPSNIRGCQSGTWSQRGTKVNGPYHGDNPLLRPTGIQIATLSYATLQAKAPTNIKTVHQTSLVHTRYIESSLDRLGLLSPTHDQRSQQQTGQITFQPVLIDKPMFLKVIHRTKKRKIEIPRSMVVEALSW